MNQIITSGIVLRRVDYGEADRIVTMLTPDQGKLGLMAKGVRRPKSKLAGGIELFSVSTITFIRGKSDLGTLISCRLDKHYGDIVKDIRRVQLGYELIKILDKATEDEPEADYFDLLEQAFSALDNTEIPASLIHAWYLAQLLRLDGHSPNLQTDTAGQKLDAAKRYNLDAEAMTCVEHPEGTLSADHIKFLRLLFSGTRPAVLAKVEGQSELVDQLLPLLQAMHVTHLRA